MEEKFQLKYDPQTLGVFILNTPEMFERAFLPFLKELNSIETLHDPIDEFMNLHFNKMQQVDLRPIFLKNNHHLPLF